MYAVFPPTKTGSCALGMMMVRRGPGGEMWCPEGRAALWALLTDCRRARGDRCLPPAGPILSDLGRRDSTPRAGPLWQSAQRSSLPLLVFRYSSGPGSLPAGPILSVVAVPFRKD
ncbi:hypothetical protein NDU88_008124 [Pleurodeles waltl]|uniref:Uncharacterized protein n=1 Tax=Pleurodeles waltl TaxID=8319 RepID=A0AAV7N8T7_PLEWA|nr:hypothetical protein NDU88_008124 [Pleurodeles waltl]